LFSIGFHLFLLQFPVRGASFLYLADFQEKYFGFGGKQYYSKPSLVLHIYEENPISWALRSRSLAKI
jgi:hypothetical protein